MSARIFTTAAALAVGTVLAATALAQAKEGSTQPPADENTVSSTTPTAWTEGEDSPVVVHVTKTVTVKARPGSDDGPSPAASHSADDPAGDGVHHRRGNGDDDAADHEDGDGVHHGAGNGDDDAADHEDGDDDGTDDRGHDAGDDQGDDGAGHDAGDDHGDDSAQAG